MGFVDVKSLLRLFQIAVALLVQVIYKIKSSGNMLFSK